MEHDLEKITRAANLIKKGGVIVFPTEGVYGLSCSCFNEDAILRIIAIKKRAPSKGLIIISDSIDRIKNLVSLDSLHDSVKVALPHLWPGHNTIILPKKASVSHLLSGDFNSLAIRVTNFSPLIELIKLADCPIVSTSANLSGYDTITDLIVLEQCFGSLVDYICPLACGNSKFSSTIIDGQSGAILRQGKK